MAHRPQYTLHVFLMMGTPKKEPPILVSPYVLRWGLSPAQQAGDFGVRARQRSPSSRCLLVLSREYGNIMLYGDYTPFVPTKNQ